MYAKDPSVVERQQVMKNLLVDYGLSIAEVATRVGLSKKRVYSFAASRKLPYNRPVKQGGRKEAQILRMLALGHAIEDIGDAFDMAVPAVENVIRSARATQVCNSAGHTREAAPPVSQATGDAG
jgi:predicted DNA-binding transcriptional regulator AlpA|tara:strand:+ start:180 stop:551 length:372 start_codon:yes stop_codon:yes gene_type:complete